MLKTLCLRHFFISQTSPLRLCPFLFSMHLFIPPSLCPSARALSGQPGVMGLTPQQPPGAILRTAACVCYLRVRSFVSQRGCSLIRCDPEPAISSSTFSSSSSSATCLFSCLVSLFFLEEITSKNKFSLYIHSVLSSLAAFLYVSVQYIYMYTITRGLVMTRTSVPWREQWSMKKGLVVC